MRLQGQVPAVFLSLRPNPVVGAIILAFLIFFVLRQRAGFSILSAFFQFSPFFPRAWRPRRTFIFYPDGLHRHLPTHPLVFASTTAFSTCKSSRFFFHVPHFAGRSRFWVFLGF